jgi:hypothetical protein
MIHLALQWPRTVAFADLLPAADAACGHQRRPPARASPPGRRRRLRAEHQFAQSLRLRKLVEAIFTRRLRGRGQQRPTASPWARQIAGTEPKVTNLRHERVELDPLSQFLVPYLDGTRTFDQLLELLLAGPVASGKLVAQQNDQSVTDPAAIRALLAGELQDNLGWLGRAALLVA